MKRSKMNRLGWFLVMLVLLLAAIAAFLHVGVGIAGHHPPTGGAYFAETFFGMSALAASVAASFRI